jgi:ankyrin repeat protein
MAKETYIFIPYEYSEKSKQGASLHDLALKWKQSATIQAENGGYDKNKIPAKIIHYNPQNETPLDFLANKDPDTYKVYVLAHGKYETTMIGNERSFNLADSDNMTPQELSNRLIKNGLPKNIKNLNLYLCNSGKYNQEGTSIAKEISQELSNKDFEQVLVKGYYQPLLPIVDDSKHKKYWNSEQSGRPSEVAFTFKSGIEQKITNNVQFSEHQELVKKYNVTDSFGIKSYDDALKFLNLDINSTTLDQIKKQYKQLSKVYHPDKGGEAEQFNKLKTAYTIFESFYNEELSLGGNDLKKELSLFNNSSKEMKSKLMQDNPKYFTSLHTFHMEQLKQITRQIKAIPDQNIEREAQRRLDELRSDYERLKKEYMKQEQLIKQLDVTKSPKDSKEEMIKLIINFPNADGDVPLHTAVKNNDIKKVEDLIKAGADVSAKTSDGKLSIHIAVEKNNIDMVNALNKGKSILDALSHAGKRPLHIAVENHNEPMIRALKKMGANMNSLDFNGKRPIDIAIEKNDVPLIKVLKELNVNFSFISESGKQAVRDAILNGNSSALSTLKEENAKFNFSDEAYLAIANNQEEMLELLGRIGVKLNWPKSDELTENLTPLTYAIMLDNEKAVNELLKQNVMQVPLTLKLGNRNENELTEILMEFVPSIVEERCRSFLKGKMESSPSAEKININPSELAFLLGNLQVQESLERSHKNSLEAFKNIKQTVHDMKHTDDLKNINDYTSSGISNY